MVGGTRGPTGFARGTALAAVTVKGATAGPARTCPTGGPRWPRPCRGETQKEKRGEACSTHLRDPPASCSWARLWGQGCGGRGRGGQGCGEQGRGGRGEIVTEEIIRFLKAQTSGGNLLFQFLP